MIPTFETVSGLYREITLRLIERKLTITTMESCTGGLIASLITDTEGSSAVLRGAFVTYSNEAKIMRGVPAETIERYGVYSEETARAMAAACKAEYSADIGVGITGTLGRPDPENPDSVSGEVFFAIAAPEKISSYAVNLPPLPDRFSCKLSAANHAAKEIIKAII